MSADLARQAVRWAVWVWLLVALAPRRAVLSPVACRFAQPAELWVSRLAMQVVLALRLVLQVRLSVQHPVIRAGLLVTYPVLPEARPVCRVWRAVDLALQVASPMADFALRAAQQVVRELPVVVPELMSVRRAVGLAPLVV